MNTVKGMLRAKVRPGGASATDTANGMGLVQPQKFILELQRPVARPGPLDPAAGEPHGACVALAGVQQSSSARGRIADVGHARRDICQSDPALRVEKGAISS